MASFYEQLFAFLLPSRVFRRMLSEENQNRTRAMLRTVKKMVPFIDQPFPPHHTQQTHDEPCITLPFSITMPIASSIPGGGEEVATIYFNRDGRVKIQSGSAQAITFNEGPWRRAEKGVLREIVQDHNEVVTVKRFIAPMPSRRRRLDIDNPGPSQTSASSSTSSLSSSFSASSVPPPPPARPLSSQGAFRLPEAPPQVGPSRLAPAAPTAPIAGSSRPQPQPQPLRPTPRTLQREYSFCLPHRPPRADVPPPSRAFDLTENEQALGLRCRDVLFRRFEVEMPEGSAGRAAYLMRKMFEDAMAQPDLPASSGAGDGWLGTKRSREEFEGDHDSDHEEEPEKDGAASAVDALDVVDKQPRKKMGHTTDVDEDVVLTSQDCVEEAGPSGSSGSSLIPWVRRSSRHSQLIAGPSNALVPLAEEDHVDERDGDGSAGPEGENRKRHRKRAKGKGKAKARAKQVEDEED